MNRKLHAAIRGGFHLRNLAGYVEHSSCGEVVNNPTTGWYGDLLYILAGINNL